MIDNCNFTLNRANWKVMKISFDPTENKCAWEQLLIEYCCHSFGSIRANETLRGCLITKKMCLTYYAGKLAGN